MYIYIYISIYSCIYIRYNVIFFRNIISMHLQFGSPRAQGIRSTAASSWPPALGCSIDPSTGFPGRKSTRYRKRVIFIGKNTVFLGGLMGEYGILIEFYGDY